jgi:hypothetical protein
MHNRFTYKLFTLLCIFISTLLLYILRKQLWTTRQMTSSTTSPIAPEEARTTTILGSKHQCENVFDLNLYGYIWCDVVYGCDVVNKCDVMNIVILHGFVCLNERVRFECVYGCTIYYVNLLCRFCNSSCDGYTVFYKKKLTQANLWWLGMGSRRLASVIYDGQPQSS